MSDGNNDGNNNGDNNNNGNDPGNSGGGDGGNNNGNNNSGGEPTARELFEKALGEELSQDPSLSKFQDAASLAKSYKELEKKLSSNKGGQTPNYVTDKDSLDFSEFDGGDYKPDEKFVENFKDMIAESKAFTPEQAKMMYSWIQKQDAEAIQQAQVNRQLEMDKLEAGLKTEWGTAYDENNNLIHRVANEYMPEELKPVMIDQGWLEYPPIKKFIYNLSAHLKEDAIEKTNIVGGGMTRNQLISEQKKLAKEMLEQSPSTAPGRAKMKEIEERLATIAGMLEK